MGKKKLEPASVDIDRNGIYLNYCVL
jgi:hypothetical protein